MLDLNAYTGKNIAHRLDGIEKECYLAAWEWVKPYSGGGNVRTPHDRYSETGIMMLVR